MTLQYAAVAPRAATLAASGPEELVRRHLPLAQRLARRYPVEGSTGEELVQVATLGLLEAVDRVGDDADPRFATEAVATMVATIARLRPEASRERPPALEATIAGLEDRLGRSPRPSEVAAAAGLDQETVQVILAQRALRRAGADRRAAPAR